MSDPGEPVHLTRLAPGVYDDGHGGLHLNPAELLAANGYAVTPDSVSQIERKAAELAAAYGLEYREVDE